VLQENWELHERVGMHPSEYTQVRAGGPYPLRWAAHPSTPSPDWDTDSYDLSHERWSEIPTGLWIGGMDVGDTPPTPLERFSLIVTADRHTSPLDPPGDRQRHIIYHFEDDTLPGRTGSGAIDDACAAALDVWRNHGHVPIRCMYGQNRSAHLAARILIAHGWPASHTIFQLRQRRGSATLANPAFVADLRRRSREPAG